MRYTVDSYSLSYLLFDDGQGHKAEALYADETHSVKYEDLQHAVAYIASCKDAHLGIVELFGGDGHTTTAGVNMSLRGDINFDVTDGSDLMNRSDVNLLWDYLGKNKPRCVVMAPPCTVVCQWSQRI